ncbi:hypothetical protein C8R43DRAFT_962653 [Mycena crocata]|nr:hypothetical protein C8R43DRAFT_962653 [Mycena crocata]
MKFTSTFVSAILLAVSVSAIPIQKRGVDPNLVPQFGITAGTNPTGTGDCDGVNGIKIPCSCPPPRDQFIASLSADVAAGHDINNPGVAAPFPTDNSVGAQITRLQTSVTTLQNLFGPGKGCPAAATTFLAQIKALQSGAAPPAAAPAAPAPAPPAPAPPAPAGGVDPNLVPQFGVSAGVNPTGTGDCDGINGIKIPCSCPPPRDQFIASLSRDVAAGHDINNPGVAAPFPTDNSVGSQIARIQTSITTLQNLFGPGKGCPAAATTFLAQIKALQSGAAPPAAAPAAPAPAPPAPAPPAPAGGVDPNLVPQFGVSAGVNPTGTGDCDGINGIKIPCSCPPPRDQFIASLSANVAAGHDINNPGVPAPFPTDNSKGAQIARLQTSISSLQNLFGPGKGCPAAATTFSAQLKALTG